MEHRQIGQSMLKASELGLGCMSMSGIYGKSDDAESIATIHRALEHGINFFDTSTSYGSGHNQEIIGQAIKGRRDDVILHCKFGSRRDAIGQTTGRGSSPEVVREDCEDSLRFFGTDVIDIFCPSRIEAGVPVEDTVGAMSKLVEEGKVRYLGLSEVKPETLARGNAVHPIQSLQMEYSLWSREAEAGHLATCHELGITFIAYGTMGRGFLTGVFHQASDLADDDRRRDHPRFQAGNIEKNVELLRHIEDMAEAKGASPAQIALAWVVAKDSAIMPLPGCKTRAHLEDTIKALELTFTADELARLDQAVPPGAASGERYPPGAMSKVQH